MYNWHLWIVLRESLAVDDQLPTAPHLDELREKYRQSQVVMVPEDPVSMVNYEHIMQCSGSRNHRGGEHERLISVIDWIAKNMSGSYGLIYWNDDEDPNPDGNNRFNVIVLARGTITQRCDEFLSPIHPTVEN